MKWMAFLFAVLLSVTGVVPMAWGLTATQSGVNVEVEYKEPTTTVNATPLTDLESTNVTILDAVGNPLQSRSIAATSPNGGGAIKETFTVSAPANRETPYTFEVRAVDDNKNASEPKSATIVIDKEPPGPVE